jgi:prepilin-type processing-associated H-X9-DG protein
LANQINYSLPLWNQTASGTTTPLRSQVIEVLLCPSDRKLGEDTSAYHTMSWTNYAGAEGYDWWTRRTDPLGGIFTFQSAISIADITDGTSNTIMLGEVTSLGFKNGPHQTTGTGIPRVGSGEAVFRPALVSPPFSDSQGNANTSTGGFPSPDGANNPQTSWVWWKAGPHAYKPTYLACWGINSDWESVSSFHPGGAQFCLADGSVRIIPETVEHINNYGGTVQGGVWMKLNNFAGNQPVAVP